MSSSETDVYPKVSIIVPMKNEEQHISLCLESLVGQDYPKDAYEVLVMDGTSSDRSREIAAGFGPQYPFIKLLDNPKGTAPAAMNIGIKMASGDIIIRVDAHAHLEADYVRRCVQYLKSSEADVVGGPIVNVPGDSLISQAISLALSHPFGIGNAKFRQPGRVVQEQFVDTVPFGAYRRQVFDRVGLFNETLTRNQDIEMNQRIRRSGGKLLLAPDIRSYYHSRDTLRGLWKQNFANGTWNVKTLKEAPGTLSLRHTVPFFFVTGLAGSGLLAIFFKAGLYLLAAIACGYIVLALLFSAMLALRHGRRHFFALPVVFGCLHLSYGLGYYAGFKRFGLPLGGFVWKK